MPENSIPAFRRAVEKGFIIELDVAMTKDKKLVVYHDKKLRRGLGIDQYLHELTYEGLSQNIRSSGPRKKSPSSAMSWTLWTAGSHCWLR